MSVHVEVARTCVAATGTHSPAGGPSTVEGVTRPDVRVARELRDKHRDDRREARRTQLLDDAIEAIREVGVGATMEQLARRGGVTKPILYRHFGDREGLIKAIAQGFSTQLFAEIQGALHTTDDPKELLDRTVDAYVGFIEREPALYRFLLLQVANPTTGRMPAA